MNISKLMIFLSIIALVSVFVFSDIWQYKSSSCGDLVLEMLMDGNALDTSGCGNDGTVTGATVTKESKHKKAYYFDGSDDYIEVPNADQFNLTDNFSIFFWLDRNSNTVDSEVIDKDY